MTDSKMRINHNTETYSMLKLTLGKKIYFTLGFLLLIIQPVFADSPLTSTEFYKAYSNQTIVILAAKSEGKLTNEVLAYLLLEENPVAIKLAVINALGWELNKKKNHQKFINDLIKKKNIQASMILKKEEMHKS